MRKIFLAFCMLGFSAAMLQAQHAAVEVPDTVLKVFHADFASVAKAEWVRDEGNTFRVLFSISQDRHHYMAKYDSDGNWLEKRIELEFTRMPMLALEEIVNKFETFKPTNTVRYERRNQKPIYQVMLTKWKPGDKFTEFYALEISEEGVLLNTPELRTARVAMEE